VQKYATPHKYATQKRQHAKKSVRPGECVRLGGCTIGATVGPDAQCVRCVRGGNSSYTKEMRYGSPVTLNHRAPAPAPRPARSGVPSARHKRPRRASFRPAVTTGLAYPCKRLRLSRLAITVYNTRHMEWVLQSKPANLQRETGHRGGGGSTCYYDGDDDALPPSDFFSPTGPLRACPTPVACPTVRMAACVHVVPLGAIDVFLWGGASCGTPG
jgi:hypothetical protein